MSLPPKAKRASEAQFVPSTSWCWRTCFLFATIRQRPSPQTWTPPALESASEMGRPYVSMETFVTPSNPNKTDLSLLGIQPDP